MHPDIAQALAEARIADLHRHAAHARLARQAAPRTPSRFRADASSAFAAGRAWFTATTTRTPAPACCPA